MSDESTHFMTICTQDVRRFSPGVKHSQPFPCTATLGLPCAGHGRRETGQGTQDKGHGTQDARRDTGQGKQDTGHRTQDTGHGTQEARRDTGHGTRDTGHGTPGTRHGTRDTAHGTTQRKGQHKSLSKNMENLRFCEFLLEFTCLAEVAKH